MTDTGSILDRLVGGFAPDQDRGLEQTLRRVRRRDRNRKGVSAVVALGVFVGTAAVLALGLSGSSLLAGPVAQGEGEFPACWTFGAEGSEACRGDIREVGSGTEAGEQWSLRVAPASATPGFEGEDESALLCWDWEYGLSSSIDCLAGVGTSVDSENRGGIIVDHSDGGPDAAPQSAYMGPTPAETTSVTLSYGDGDVASVREATLFGPFEQDLGTDAKLFLGFAPPSIETTIVTVTAYDAEGKVLWEQEVPWFTD
jgi:hypothetical protein